MEQMMVEQLHKGLNAQVLFMTGGLRTMAHSGSEEFGGATHTPANACNSVARLGGAGYHPGRACWFSTAVEATQKTPVVE